jgi:hypothetical protein
MTKEEEKELEDFIADWYYDEQSHRFAHDLGRYLFQFIDYLYEQKLTDKTVSKHIDNCWAIGYLECGYGYRDVFSPGKVFYSTEADYNYEYKRKFSDSKYALTSYRATWKKLYKYTKDLGHLEYE